MKSKNTLLPTDDAARAKVKLFAYLTGYHAAAHIAGARHSYESNIKHNGDVGMDWADDKSIGDGEQIMRHLFDYAEAKRRGDWNEAYYHLTCAKWRNDELLHRLVTGMAPFNDPENPVVIDVDVVYATDHEHS